MSKLLKLRIALATIQAIQSEKQPLPSPLFNKDFTRGNAEQEIVINLFDLRTAKDLLDDPAGAVCDLVCHLAGLRRAERSQRVKNMCSFLGVHQIMQLLDNVIENLETRIQELESFYTTEEINAFYLDQEDLEGSKDFLIEAVTEYMSPLDVKKYFDKEGQEIGFYIQITSGGPTIYYHGLNEAGAFITCTGYSDNSEKTERLGGYEYRALNQLYLAE